MMRHGMGFPPSLINFPGALLPYCISLNDIVRVPFIRDRIKPLCV